MKKFQCDICGLLTSEYKLKTLLQHLQIKESPHPEIEHICVECCEQITEAQRKIKTALSPIETSWMKQIILKLRWKKWPTKTNKE